MSITSYGPPPTLRHEERDALGTALQTVLIDLIDLSLVAIALVLYAAAGGVRFARASAWVTHAALNALGMSVLLPVTVGRRWPFTAT